MYDFIDVNEQPDKILSAEAVSINGEYLDEIIPGFKTLYVQGREMIAPELKSKTVGSRHGEVLLNSRYTDRKIVVGYQLIAEDGSAFREAYIKLMDKLNLPNSRIIFFDEEDKYWTGTLCNVGDVPTGVNAVTAEFTIGCLDPLKYSVIAEEVNPSLDGGKAFYVDYKGTMTAHPSVVVEFTGDCGYVALFDETKHALQFGNPDEIDGITTQESKMLVNTSFTI